MKFKKITFSYLPTYKSKDIKSSAANYLGLRHTWLQTRCFRNSYFDLITEKKSQSDYVINKFRVEIFGPKTVNNS